MNTQTPELVDVISAGRRLDAEARQELRSHFESQSRHSGIAPVLRSAYYKDLYGFVQKQIPKGARVLDIGCGEGALLASLEPSVGVGIDISHSALRAAKSRYPHLQFVHADAEEIPVSQPFDYVVATNAVGFLFDVWEFLRNLSTVVHPETRVILTGYNFVWEPLLKIAQVLRLKSREPVQNWLSLKDLENLLALADFETISAGYRMVLPTGPRFITGPLNRLLSGIPILRWLGITYYVVARPHDRKAAPRIQDPSCSVIICTRNERGNVRPNVERIPELGSHTEIVFIDGNSTDGTAQEVEHVIDAFPHKDIRLIHQGEARGKGEALHMGMTAAKGDVLMVLDADLTVAPEELTKFWAAIVEEKGEFINGSRLVYPLEKDSMRLANAAGNKTFGLVFSWILDQRITDTLCANKVLWARDYRRLMARRDEFGRLDPFGDFDLLFGAANLGLKIREVPIRYRARVYGSTNISRWSHGVLLLRMAIKGALRLRLR